MGTIGVTSVDAVIQPKLMSYRPIICDQGASARLWIRAQRRILLPSCGAVSIVRQTCAVPDSRLIAELSTTCCHRSTLLRFPRPSHLERPRQQPREPRPRKRRWRLVRLCQPLLQAVAADDPRIGVAHDSASLSSLGSNGLPFRKVCIQDRLTRSDRLARLPRCMDPPVK